MKKLLLIALLFSVKTKAQTYVTIPDANFASYLQSTIPAAMSGNQMDITNPLVTTTTHSINVESKNIVNLNGIQYFTSLKYLNCYYNNITTLPALPNTLTYLFCPQNYLTSLPTLPPLLDTLVCSFNIYLKNLPALPNSLIYLECEYDSLANLPSLPNSLAYLDCEAEEGNFTVLPTLPNSLSYLDCGLNHLISLPILPNSLTYLDCWANDISCFPIFPNTIIDSSSFDISSNPFNCLPNYITAMTTTDLAYPLCAVGNTNGCPIAVTGIEQYINSNEQINIYPNPNNGSFVVESNNATKQTMQLYDVNGKLVLSQIINGRTSIDASGLNEGVYNISLQSNEGVVNKRLVIVR